MLMETIENQKEHLTITHYFTAQPLLSFCCTSSKLNCILIFSTTFVSIYQYNLLDLELILSLSWVFILPIQNSLATDGSPTHLTAYCLPLQDTSDEEGLMIWGYYSCEQRNNLEQLILVNTVFKEISLYPMLKINGHFLLEDDAKRYKMPFYSCVLLLAPCFP